MPKTPMPRRTLISFLGKPHQTGTAGGYRQACYDFGHGHTITTSFFGLALQQMCKPDRLVFLGTSGSMWDALVEHHLVGAEAEAERLQLMEAVERHAVTEAHLDALEPIVADRLQVACRFALIPHGRTEPEQYRILGTLADTIEPGDTVILDLTHGLRHLPLLGFVSALYLQVTRQVAIEALYYGALDLTNEEGRTPVLRLDGLWQLVKWLTALHAFDKDQDYAAFAELLEQHGFPKAVGRNLQQAAFYERTMRVTEARRPLREFWRSSPRPFPPPADLIEPLLDERTAWRDVERLSQRQKDLALFYLENRDYLRSVIFALEGFVTSLMQTRFPDKDPQNYAHRQEAKDQYETSPHATHQEWLAYCQLRNIRNTLVHATRPTRAEEQALLQEEDRLRTTLARIYNQLMIHAEFNQHDPNTLNDQRR